MGKALAEHSELARLAFDEANEALGFDLAALCWNGPQEELDRTANAQPALLTTSIAALRAARGAGLSEPPVVAAGHSLGEFSALVALGVLALPDAVRLVRQRGELMQAADPSGGMAAVIGLDAAAVTAAIEGSDLVVANDNAPGQVVVSGPLSAFAVATERLRAAGAKRVLALRVSAAFHSPAMRSVAPALAAAMAEIRFVHPTAPVIANVDATPHSDERELPGLLERQVWSPVRWVDVITRAAGEGAATFVEFGAGAVLTGLTRRILPAARTTNVSDPATLEEALRVLR
jgi:[acyl-carrier-protein] S-malonyltransferase